MIDRKTFWTVMAFVAIMLAMAAWRISLLPDWTHLPRYDLNGVAIAPINSAVLLAMPGAVLFTMARLTWRARTARDPGEALRPWRKWTRWLALSSAIVTLTQAFLITRSLGVLTINPVLFSRSGLVVLGLLAMVMNNAVPKLPWLQSRIAFLNLDPDKGARFLRFKGWFGVMIGMVAVLGGLFLPITIIPPVVLSMVLASVVAGLVFRFSGRRGQPQ